MAHLSWMTSAWIMFAVLVCTHAQDVPTTTCYNGYFGEGETLNCTCLGGCSNGERPTLTWPGHSDTERLEKTSITREQDGHNFTCRRVCGSEKAEVNYTLRVTYGPDASTTKINGPSFFVTNGTLPMMMTCKATVNPSPSYTWNGVTCDNGNNYSTCTYTPSILDDGKRVTCLVVNKELRPAKSVSVGFDTSISYPPQTAPSISGGPSPVLTAEDILTCTVTGGKPLVDSVNFSCTSPYDVLQVHTTNTSVSSSLTIDTSQATTDNTTCYCSANWAPRPQFYTMDIERHILTQYPAKVKIFLLNNTNKTVTVTESDHRNVTIQCEASGRPGLSLLLKKTSHDGTVTLNEKHVDSNDVTYTYIDHSITMADWTDMGNYTCVVWNHVGDNDSIQITLNVNSPPRPASEQAGGRDRNRPLNMTTEGILIELRAYPQPAPESFTYIRYTSESDQTGLTVSFDSFNSQVTTRGPGNNFVAVTVTGRNVLHVGVHKVTISNDFGSAEFYFSVNEKMIRTSGIPITTSDTAAIVGGIVGAVILVSIAIVIVVIIWRRKYQRYEKPQPRREDEGSPYTELQPPPFANSEEGIVNYANTEPRPDLSQPDDTDNYVNVETTQNTYEHIQPRSESVTDTYTTLNATN